MQPAKQVEESVQTGVDVPGVRILAADVVEYAMEVKARTMR
jgi:hypothetical protein